MTAVSQTDLNNAKLDCDTISAIVNSMAATTITRLGAVIDTLTGVLAKIHFQVPVAYAAAIAITTGTQTVLQGNVIYAPIPSFIPFSTPGVFDPSQWYPVSYVISAFIQTLIDDPDAATARATLGVSLVPDFNAATTDTVLALGDFVPYTKISAGNASKKITLQNFFDQAVSLFATKATPIPADKIVIGDSAAGNATKQATIQTLLNAVHALTAKTSIVAADEFFIIDSAASNVAKRLSYTNFKATLQKEFFCQQCWAFATVAAGVPTLVASFNITSITDAGVGLLTITIATDFTTANWAPVATIRRPNTTMNANNVFQCAIRNALQAAGSIQIECYSQAPVLADPDAWSFNGSGQQ